jgi:coproporphyrinogen III oxidase-like Fe-S oxidoreductase
LRSFLIIALSAGEKPSLESIPRELGLYSASTEIGKVDRVYISGGTPSLLHKEIGQLLDVVRSHFDFSGKVAMEAGPGDLNEEVLGNFVSSGVKQLSVGVQTFNERVAALISRRQDNANCAISHASVATLCVSGQPW